MNKVNIKMKGINDSLNDEIEKVRREMSSKMN